MVVVRGLKRAPQYTYLFSERNTVTKQKSSLLSHNNLTNCHRRTTCKRPTTCRFKSSDWYLTPDCSVNTWKLTSGWLNGLSPFLLEKGSMGCSWFWIPNCVLASLSVDFVAPLNKGVPRGRSRWIVLRSVASAGGSGWITWIEEMRRETTLQVRLSIQCSWKGHIVQSSLDSIHATVWLHPLNTIFCLVWGQLPAKLFR